MFRQVRRWDIGKGRVLAWASNRVSGPEVGDWVSGKYNGRTLGASLATTTGGILEMI